MGRSYTKSKGRGGGGPGYGALPRNVWKHPDYCNLSGSGAKLLMDLACQFNGRNNGDLTVAYSLLRERGWSSKATIKRAVDELLQACLIRQSRPGRFTNPGGQPALYALCWLPIDECPGKNLELPPTTVPFRKFSLEASRMPGPESGQGSVHKRGRQRARDDAGKFQSVHKRGRLVDVA